MISEVLCHLAPQQSQASDCHSKKVRGSDGPVRHIYPLKKTGEKHEHVYNIKLTYM